MGPFDEWQTHSRYLLNDTSATVASKTTSSANSVQQEKPNPHTLLSLPPELHLKIVSYYRPWKDASYLCLRLTNQYFYHTLPALNHEDLLQIQNTRFSQERRLFVC